MPIRFDEKAEENSSAHIGFTLKYSGTAVPVSDITSMTLTLIDGSTLSVINERTATDVKSYVDESGVFSFWLTPEDNVMLSENAEELHIALFTVVATIGGSTVTFNKQALIVVERLKAIL